MIIEIAVIVVFSAIINNDKVGVILFSNEVELFIPPRKGKCMYWRIIRDLLEFELCTAAPTFRFLQVLNQCYQEKMYGICAFDFRGPQFMDAIKIASKKHDVIAMRISDKMETEMPKAGMVQFMDNETGKIQLIDLDNKKVREGFHKVQFERDAEIRQVFKKSGVDFAEIIAGENYIKPLNQLFRVKRGEKIDEKFRDLSMGIFIHRIFCGESPCAKLPRKCQDRQGFHTGRRTYYLYDFCICT